MITGNVGNITGLDIGIVVLYFLIVLAFGLWSSLKNRGSVGGYFLAGRSMNFILVGTSIFSSNIGSGHFIGLAGSGATTGVAIAIFEFNAMLVLVLLGWIFMPVYMAAGIYTMPEYVCKRFGGQRIRVYLAVLALLLSIFTKISADLYAGALFINMAINWDIYSSILALVVISALFSITGGLTAVMWTDFIQTIVMISGALYLMIISFREVGGYNKMMELYLGTGYFPKKVNKSTATTFASKSTRSPTIPSTTRLSPNTLTLENEWFNTTTNNTLTGNITTTGLKDHLSTGFPTNPLTISPSLDFNSLPTFHFSQINSPNNLLASLFLHLTSNSTNTTSFHASASPASHSPMHQLTSATLSPTLSSFPFTPNITFPNSPTLLDPKFPDSTTSLPSNVTFLQNGVTQAIIVLGRDQSACAYPPVDSFHLLRSVDNQVFPWPGLFTLTVMAIWYWCSDQVIVQRALASKNLSHAKAGCLLAGYLKILPLWCIVFPGMIARILFPEIACSNEEDCMRVCGSKVGCSNLAYPKLVLHLMPSGSRGVMLSVIMSALMSSLSSVFNSSSTIFTIDIWRRLRRDCSETELMIVGRVFVLFMVGVSIAWIPIVRNFAELFNYIQSVTSYLAPPISAVYILAISWKRINETGAFWGLMVGLLIGMVRFVWENFYKEVSCGSGQISGKPSILADVHFLYFGAGLFGVVLVVVVVISLLTQKIEDKHLHRLLFSNRHSKERREDLDKAEPANDVSTTTSTVSAITRQPSRAVSVSVFSFDEPEERKGCCLRMAKWICGIEKIIKLSEEEQRLMNLKQTSLDENSRPYWINNMLALLLLVSCVAITAYYA